MLRHRDSILRKRDRNYNSYRTRIREGMRNGPNFAGQYSVIQIGCGTGCSFVIIGDNKTGRPSGLGAAAKTACI